MFSSGRIIRHATTGKLMGSGYHNFHIFGMKLVTHDLVSQKKSRNGSTFWIEILFYLF